MPDQFSTCISLHLSNDVGVLTLSRPPKNQASAAWRQAVLDAFNAAHMNSEVSAILIATDEAGLSPDLPYSERLTAQAEPTLQSLCARIASARKPVVMACRGRLADAGLEIALCATARLAHAKCLLSLQSFSFASLPEPSSFFHLAAMLGPKATLQFLGASSDIPAALPDLSALFAQIIGSNVTGQAANLAQSLAAEKQGRTYPALDEPLSYQEQIAAERNPHARTSRRAAVECLEAVLLLPYDAALDLIASQRTELSRTRETRATIHRNCTKLGLLRRQVAPPPHNLFVIGAGSTAQRIARLGLHSGMKVTLVSQDEQALVNASSRIANFLLQSVKSGHVSKEVVQVQLGNLNRTSDMSQLAAADWAIEAAAQNIEDVGEITRKARAVLPERALLLITSGIRNGAGRFANLFEARTVGALFHPDRGSGGAVEVALHSRQWQDQNLRLEIHSALRRIGQTCVFQKAQDGLVSTRLMTAFFAAAEEAVARGADPLSVDNHLPALLKPFVAQNTEGFQAQPFRLTTFFGTEDRSLPSLGSALLRAGVDGQCVSALQDDDKKLSNAAQRAISEWRMKLEPAKRLRESKTPGREAIQFLATAALYCTASKLREDDVIGTIWEADHIAAATLGLSSSYGTPSFAAAEPSLLRFRNTLRGFRPLRPAFFVPPSNLEDLIKNGALAGDPRALADL